MKRLLILVSASVALFFLIAACGSDPTITPAPTSIPAPTATAVPQINQVSFKAVDYSFSGPESIPAGMTGITFVNEGQELHHQQLLTLPDGMTVDDFMAALLSGEEGPPPPGVVGAGGVGALNPGLSGSVTLNLAPGNYVIVCFVPNAEGVPHVALGMVKPLTVTAAIGPLAAEPASDVSIDLVDFGFGLSAPISAGPQNIRVTNKGQQEHEAFLIQLDPGATANDFMSAFGPDAPPGPPPGRGLGGFQAIASGGGGTFTVDFAPGNYALVCFVEDPNTGAPHFALGMIHEFTVQ